MREDLRKFYTDPEMMQIALSGQETLKQLIGKQKRDTKGIWDEYMAYSGDIGTDISNNKISDLLSMEEEG